MLVVQDAEIADAAAGRWLGGRTIAPALSPRSWRGAGAGVGAWAFLGAGLSWLTPFGVPGAALIGAAAAAAGLAGALVLAAVKRE